MYVCVYIYIYNICRQRDAQLRKPPGRASNRTLRDLEASLAEAGFSRIHLAATVDSIGPPRTLLAIGFLVRGAATLNPKS